MFLIVFANVNTCTGFLMMQHKTALSLFIYTTRFCLCGNNGADQLCSNCKAEQCFCFHYTVQFLYFITPQFQASGLLWLGVAAQLGLCQIWSETPKAGFILSQLIQYLSPSYCWCFLTHLVTLKEINMSHRMRKLMICICENKDADQLRSTCEADQRLCLCFTDSTISLLL